MEDKNKDKMLEMLKEESEYIVLTEKYNLVSGNKITIMAFLTSILRELFESKCLDKEDIKCLCEISTLKKEEFKKKLIEDILKETEDILKEL